jgi:signal transduction histidine kinase
LSLPKTAVWTLLVAAAYYACGQLGLMLALPPGYATAVWPPSGIALAAVLLGGVRLAPGILVGSFLNNISTDFSLSALGESLWVPAAIALGATLQAMVGARLVRRAGFRRNVLAAGANVVPMLLLGGPLACLLNATLSVGVLWLAGRIDSASAPFSWWTWWIGDSIGVLLFTPLVLIWAMRPYRTWFRRQAYVTAPLVLLFTTVVVLFLFISQREQTRIEAEFRTRAADVHQGLRVRLGNTLAVLSSVEGFYASSVKVEPYEFEIFAQRLVTHLDGVAALSWNPIVRDRERATFEASARRAGFEHYRIVERGEGGAVRTAARRPFYVPVQAIAPRVGNEQVLGFDMASDPARVEAMDQARDTGRPVASSLVALAQGGQPGVLVVMPVYRLGAQDYTLEARRLYLKGFAVAVFSVEGLLGDIAARARAHGLTIALVDASDLEPKLIYGTRAALPGDLRQEFAFAFAGRAWRLEMGLEEQALVSRRSWAAWFVLAGGLLLTGLLGVLLLLGVGRTAHIEAQVAERTEELHRTGAQLARSNRELEQYAYVTSHDLKAPLRTIASFAQLLQQRHGDQLQGEAREFLDFITGGVNRMRVLIDDLLQLSRVEARTLEIAQLSMRVALDRACAALAADIAASGAVVEIGELPFVRGDLNMLSQLWQNLLANAIKFQRAGQIPQIRITARERPDDWCFSVADNGIGIPQGHREQVFYIFRRLHNADRYPGTGIGLAICRKVVQLHGGEIWAESTPGKEGSTFLFTLPKK